MISNFLFLEILVLQVIKIQHHN